MATPIWKGYTVSQQTEDDSLSYIIKCDGATIYTGKAYKRPGASDISFNIGDVCAPFLSSNAKIATATTGFMASSEMQRTFVVEDLSGTALATVDFSNDWSCKGATPNFASDPVQRKIDPRQLLLASMYEASKVIAQTEGSSPQTQTLYDGDPASGVACVDSLSGATSVTISANTTGGSSTMTYDVVKPCARYVLYYVNAFGGWDSLLTAGNDKRVDNYTRSTYKKVYSPSDLSDRGTVNYRNDINRTISLVTDWLTDEESARMHHLFGSTNVLLHDLVDNIIRPVTLTATSWTEKTFRNNGAKLVNYQIDVTIAQDFVRL
ncbi:hypothetical protein [uncultured Alistipes sp.]|uniref:hypothetical protein n=1 Tax=uncultured Alistipes sp. TaxID=538949 RepID=UPI00320A3382